MAAIVEASPESVIVSIGVSAHLTFSSREPGVSTNSTVSGHLLDRHHRHRHLDALAGRMDAVRADELVAEIVQLKAQQLHDRGGRVFNVQRDLRVAHLHDVDLLAAHLKRLGQHTDRAGDIALRHVAD